MLYLAPYIGDGQTRETRYRPAGTEGLEWSSIDLRSNPSQPGYCLVWSPSVINDPSVTLLAANFAAAVNNPAKSVLETTLGITLPAAAVSGQDLVRELLVNDFGKWPTLKASRATKRKEIWLGSEKLFESPVLTPEQIEMDPTDDFAGTNGDSLLVYSENWTLQRGNFVINTGAICPNAAFTDSVAFWDADVFADDQFSEGPLDALASGLWIGVIVRSTGHVDTTNIRCYGLYTDSANGTYFFKIYDNTYSDLASAVGVRTAGHTIRISVSGTTISYLDDGAAIISPVTDATISSGSAGISGYSNGTGSRLGSWTGGNVSADVHGTRMRFAFELFDETFVQPVTTVSNDLAASATIVFANTGNLNASGELLAVGNIAFSPVADLDASGTIEAAATLVFSTAADLDAAGDMLAVGSITWTTAADLDALANILAAATVTFSTSADLDATGALDATADIAFTTAADLTTPKDIDAVGSITFTTSADLDATGTLEAVGAIAFTTEAVLATAGVLVAAGAITWTTAADLDAIGNLLAVGDLAFTTSADLTEQPAPNDLLATGSISFANTADLRATGAMLAVASLAFTTSADLDATAQLLAVGNIAWTSTALLYATGRLDASADLTFSTSADLDLAGVLMATGQLTLTGSVTLDATGNIVAVGLLTFTESALVNNANEGVFPHIDDPGLASSSTGRGLSSGTPTRGLQSSSVRRGTLITH